jgi:hypothetical protein
MLRRRGGDHGAGKGGRDGRGAKKSFQQQV